MALPDSQPRPLVPYIDPDTGEEIKMELFLKVDHQARVYALLTPAEWAIDVVREVTDPDGELSLEPVESERLPGLRKDIQSALSQYNLKVHLHDDQLFLAGDPPEEFFDVETIEAEDDEDELELAVLLELDTGEESMMVVMPTEPELFPVELVDGKGRALSDAELEELEHRFRKALAMYEEDAEGAEE
jgi:hypothetical protein